MTRNLEELMKSQVMSPDNTINQAVNLNKKIEGLQEQNFSLQDENENLSATNESFLTERGGFIQMIRDQNKELEEIKSSAAFMEKKLRGELKSIQASWDSLYKDHCEQEQQHQQQQQNNKSKPVEVEGEEIDSSSESQSQQINRVHEDITTCSSTTTTTPNNISQEENTVTNQAELLRKAVNKQVVSPSNTVSPMLLKLHELEAENKTLKSAVVRLQTQYKEEKYKNEHISSDSFLNNCVNEDESSSPSPVGELSSSVQGRGRGLFGFSKRTSPNVSATSSAPPVSTSTWGRMSNRNSQIGNQDSNINLNIINNDE
jgi:chromosome segregation ATPase